MGEGIFILHTFAQQHFKCFFRLQCKPGWETSRFSPKGGGVPIFEK